ncbi:MAG: RidA family protein [Actinobacteria bacterium]|nr:RidA family protein [Actinomycetota bacterium]
MGDYQRVDARRTWAPVIGYSRAVRRGNVVEVSGTSATSPEGLAVHPGDAYAQTAYILAEVLRALAELGGSPSDVVRTRAYLTNIDDWQAVGRAHGEVFAAVMPACSFVEISRLMLPELVVEIELTAILASA